MRVDKRMSLEDSNEFFKDLILRDSPFLVTRIGLGGETISTVLTLHNQFIPDNVRHMFHVNAGFYGTHDYSHYSHLYKSGFDNSDCVAYWNFPGFEKMEEYLVPEEKPLVDVGVLESFRTNDPWTRLLKGKKILIVHPFKSTIDEQLLNRTKIWSNKEVLPDAEYLTYASVQSIGGIGPHKDWYESYNVMCDDISKMDFDIAFLGCGSYGVPLSYHIRKNLGKSAIYVGGGLQLYFGIKGRRWDSSKDITDNYNEYWVRPSEQESPLWAPQVEGGCYW
jgi:hypothetical protein